MKTLSPLLSSKILFKNYGRKWSPLQRPLGRSVFQDSQVSVRTRTFRAKHEYDGISHGSFLNDFLVARISVLLGVQRLYLLNFLSFFMDLDYLMCW